MAPASALEAMARYLAPTGLPNPQRYEANGNERIKSLDACFLCRKTPPSFKHFRIVRFTLDLYFRPPWSLLPLLSSSHHELRRKV